MRRLAVLLPLLALLAAPSLAQEGEAAQPGTSRWYEIHRNGGKVGYSNVLWAPSTWEGIKTVHDTTTVLRRSTRNMSGVRNVFGSTVKIDLERGPDGTLYYERYEVEEGSRTMLTEMTWTGSGYRYLSKVVGGEEERTLMIPLDAPVMTDVESFVGHQLRAGLAKEGDVLELRLLDVTNRGARISEVTIGPRELIDDAGETQIEATRVVERDPESGAESSMWIDDSGAFVQIRGEGGTFYKRVTQSAAEEMPVQPAEYSVTSAASPALERIFTADKVRVDLHLQGDPHRKPPEFPDSPWSRVLSVSGDDEQGWVYEIELLKHDLDVDAYYPANLAPGVFERDLEPTVLLPCNHPELQETARQVVGDASTMREAAHRLTRYVYETLAKRSPDVGEATALEILRDKQGDCSEHATLFVALCRAAGIPARRCSGYVCLGRVWGGHAWAEIYVGDWIAADPTTGELGPGARYLFYGYHETPGSFPGVVSARASGRMRLVATYVEEAGEGWDLTQVGNHRVFQPEDGRYVHVLAGLELSGVPRAWTVNLSGANTISVETPEGLTAYLRASADQGATLDVFGGATTQVAGVPAVNMGGGGTREQYYLHVDRQLIQLVVDQPKGAEASRELLERILARSFGTEQPEPEPVGPLTPGGLIEQVVLSEDPAAQLKGAWSLSVLTSYWQHVALKERLAVFETALERAERVSARLPDDAPRTTRSAVEAWRARSASRVAVTRASQLTVPAWLEGRELSARWVPAADLPDALSLQANAVSAAVGSARAQRQWLSALEGGVSLEHGPSVVELLQAAEITSAEELAEIQARLEARLAHDRLLQHEGQLLARYGLEGR